MGLATTRGDTMSIETQMKLAGTRVGRVVLHLVGLAMDKRVKWHYQGIMREVMGV